MFEKVATKPELTKPSQIIDYLKKCDTVAREDAVVPTPPQQPQQPQQPPAAYITPVNEPQIDASFSYGYNNQNRGSFRGQYNYRGRRGTNSFNRGQSANCNYQNNSSQNNRKPTFCIYCRKPNHD